MFRSIVYQTLSTLVQYESLYLEIYFTSRCKMKFTLPKESAASLPKGHVLLTSFIDWPFQPASFIQVVVIVMLTYQRGMKLVFRKML